MRLTNNRIQEALRVIGTVPVWGLLVFAMLAEVILGF